VCDGHEEQHRAKGERGLARFCRQWLALAAIDDPVWWHQFVARERPVSALGRAGRFQQKLIGQGWTAYVYESRVDRSEHGGAVTQGCGSQSSPQKVGHSRLN
jgi:hypothetical protein